MRHRNIILCTILLLGFGLTGLKAQEAIPATGGGASGSKGSVSYSIGQVVYTTNIGTTGSVGQGVQQPYEISVVVGLTGTKDITLQCSAYPNPTSDFVILKVENFKIENLTYQLYDVNGKLLKTQKVENKETIISMRNLIHAVYFLQIIDNKRGVKTFRIIKN